MDYDVLIIGAGPAGCSAALTLRSRGRSVLVAYAGDGALEKAPRVDNYPGLPHISGQEMIEKFRNQAKDAGAALRHGVARQIVPMGDSFSVLIGQDILSVRGVMLCGGVSRGGQLPGEDALVGQGVSYCATCDGMLYRGQDVIVLSSFDEGVEEANFLADIAGSVTYFAEKSHDMQGLSPKARLIDEKPLEVLPGPKVRTDKGEYGAACVFIARPAMPLNQLLPGLEINGGRVRCDDKGRTNLPNVYAAGDITGAPYQIANAVGQGNVAALDLDKVLGRG